MMSDFSNLTEGMKLTFNNGLFTAVATIEKVVDNQAFVGEKRRYIVKTEKGYTSIISPSEVLVLCE